MQLIDPSAGRFAIARYTHVRNTIVAARKRRESSASNAAAAPNDATAPPISPPSWLTARPHDAVANATITSCTITSTVMAIERPRAET